MASQFKPDHVLFGSFGAQKTIILFFVEFVKHKLPFLGLMLCAFGIDLCRMGTAGSFLTQKLIRICVVNIREPQVRFGLSW